MLYVTSLDGLQVEPLTQFNKFQMEQEVNGVFQVSFTSFNLPNNPAHAILNEESIITVDDFDFRVKQISKNRHSTSVVADSIFFDLVDKRQNTTLTGTHSFNDFATFTFNNTGWTFTSDITSSATIENFGNANVIVLVQNLCGLFDCEYEIKSNNHIHFTKEIGGDYDAQYRYKHNVKALSENIDTTKLKTQITVTGAEGLSYTYTSSNHKAFGIREAEPIEDDDLTDMDSLKERAKSELIDYPEAYFEMDTIELTDKKLGEKVWLIYEPMNIEFHTRVLSQTKEFRADKLVTTKVILGNTIPKTVDSILYEQKNEINENKKTTESRFEQTDDRISFEVERFDESIASLEITADQISSSVTNLENGMNSKITQTAEEIRAEVQAEITTVENDIKTVRNDVSSVTQTASQIQSTVTSQQTTINNQGNRITSAESSITQQANQIAQKVSQTDYNGNTIASLINQTATSITIQASKIELRGAVSVLSDISGNLGTITSGNINIYEDLSVGSGIYLKGRNGDLFRGIYFGRTQINQDNSGWLNIGQNVSIGSFSRFNGSVDMSGTNLNLSGANVTGLNLTAKWG